MLIQKLFLIICRAIKDIETKNYWNFVYWSTAPCMRLFRQALGLPGYKPAKYFIYNIAIISIGERILL